MESQHSFVSWFRDSSPYIHAHRNKTFVISFGGEAVLANDLDHHVHDFALLSQGMQCVPFRNSIYPEHVENGTLNFSCPFLRLIYSFFKKGKPIMRVFSK
jgi:hypothetical protein